LAAACKFIAGSAEAAEVPAPQEHQSATRVRVAFAAKCAQCHGPDRRPPEGGFGYVLDIGHLAANRRLVVPFQPERSKLWALVRDGEMPPEDSEHGPLTTGEKNDIRRWIAEGAPIAESPLRADTAPSVNGRTAQPFPGRFLGWVGRFHIVVVHFPIALLLAAALAEGLLAIRPIRGLETAVRFCLLLGAASAAAAIVLGWLHADIGGYGKASAENLYLHRWLGTLAGLFAVGAAALGEIDVRHCRRQLSFRCMLLVAAVLVGAAGHLGGLLVHGDTFLNW
jgi:mono/diheme cytochrome c family protein